MIRRGCSSWTLRLLSRFARCPQRLQGGRPHLYAVRSERPAMEVSSIGLMLAHDFELFEYGYGKLCSAHSGCSPSRRIDMVHYTQ